MELIIRADTFEGLRDKIFSIALEFGINRERVNLEVVPNAIEPEAEENKVASLPRSATQKPLKKKPEKQAKPTKVDVKSPAIETESENQVESSEAEISGSDEKLPTADDVFEALKEVVSVRGEPTGRELLTKFGAPRRSSLREDLYPAFIKECKARVLEAAQG